jgi:alpha-glucosidase
MGTSTTNKAGIDTAPTTTSEAWWKQAVVYQIYPRSFKDTTGSGLGDIVGITSKIDYLKQLGVDAIWLSPFYPSELADGGYDVADYRNVDPKLGSMTDFDELAEAAHQQDIKVVVDIVPNHSSDQHPWFQEALRAEPGSPERERYIFRNGKGEHGELPPTQWISSFGSPAWTRVSDGQWYLHMFAKEQPDFNWNNPEIREDFLTTLRFWSDHGADGFRIDVAHGLVKDLDRDDLDRWSINNDTLPSDGSHPLYDRDELHDIYRSWRKVFNEYNPPRFAVAEAWVNPQRQYLYSSPDELGQIFNFEFAKKNWVRDELHEAIEDGIAQAQRSGSTSTWVMSNHDVPRHASRYGLPQVSARQHHRLAADWILRNGDSYFENRELGNTRARAAILLELALPGSSYIYQGEELGLPEVPDIPWDALEDPESQGTSRTGMVKGRDGCRVPLPWIANDAPVIDDNQLPAAGVSRFGHIDSASGAGSFGFSPKLRADGITPSAEPHLPQPDWFRQYAVDTEESDEDSMLSLYRSALKLRHHHQCTDGTLTWLEAFDQSSTQRDGADGQHGGAIAYKRANGWANITNFSDHDIALPEGEILLSSAPLHDGKLPTDTSVWIQL